MLPPSDTLPGAGDRPTPRLHGVRSFACYYGFGNLQALGHFDLLLLHPGAHTSDQLAFLRTRGARVLAYLSLGEQSGDVPDAPWHLRTAEGLRWENPAWGTVYVDTRDPAWTRWVVETQLPRLRASYDGVFLDTLDTAEQFPQLHQGTVALVLAIRRAWQDAVVIINRGFCVLDRVEPAIDGLVFEAFTSYCREGQYGNWTSRDLSFNAHLAARVNALRRSRGWPVFSLDYAAPNEATRAAYALGRARRFGFVPYVSTGSLNEVFCLPAERR